MNLYFLVSLLLISFSCKQASTSAVLLEDIKSNELDQSVQPEKRYDFAQPSQTFALPSALTEISGLVYQPEQGHLLAINDEEGKVFSLSPQDGSILNVAKFGKKGDYEGITYHNGTTYIVRSDGRLYSYLDNPKQSTQTKTAFTSKNDIEGLAAFDSTLYIACKRIGLDNDTKTKIIYKSSVAEGLKKVTPYIKLSQEDLESKVGELYSDVSKSNLKKQLNRIKKFAPSGIAVHPLDFDFYILSARGSTLTIVNQNGDIKDVIFLSSGTIPQPEGLCFDRDRNLYISTEGRGLVAKIFKYQPL